MILLLEALLASTNVNSPATIAAITGFGEAKLHVVLRALQSVTEIQSDPVFDDVDDNEPNGTSIRLVKISHRSFYDFLVNKAQSGPYFIDTALFGAKVLCRILELATISIKELKDAEGDPTSFDALERRNPQVRHCQSRPTHSHTHSHSYPHSADPGLMHIAKLGNHLTLAIHATCPPQNSMVRAG